MSNCKNYWYVLVLTESGAKFVTKIDHGTKCAFWNENDQPLLMSMATSKDLALGLCCNGYNAFPVCVAFKLDNQPYRYDLGCFKWVSNNE